PLGKVIANRVREAGVSDEFVQYADDRCGVYFLEVGAAPRASGIVYDRKDSAASKIAPGMFDWSKIFAGAKWFHVTGITAALSRTASDAVGEALRLAKEAGLRTSIDLNYRSKLWSTTDAGRALSGLIVGCDLLIASEGDAQQLFDIAGSHFSDIAKQF